MIVLASAQIYYLLLWCQNIEKRKLAESNVYESSRNKIIVTIKLY